MVCNYPIHWYILFSNCSAPIVCHTFGSVVESEPPFRISSNNQPRLFKSASAPWRVKQQGQIFYFSIVF